MQIFRQGNRSGKDMLRDVLVNVMEKLKEGLKETGYQAVSSIKDALDTVQW